MSVAITIIQFLCVGGEFSQIQSQTANTYFRQTKLTNKKWQIVDILWYAFENIENSNYYIIAKACECDTKVFYASFIATWYSVVYVAIVYKLQQKIHVIIKLSITWYALGNNFGNNM